MGVFASKDVVAGDEVFISYRDCGNGPLLLACGFVLEGNPSDCVELTLTLKTSSATLPLFQDLAKARAVPQIQVGDAVANELLVRSNQDFVQFEGEDVLVHFRVSDDRPLGDPALLSFLRLGMRSTHPGDKALERLREGKPISDVHELEALKALHGALVGMLAGYPRSLEEDEAMLSRLSSEGPSRTASALRVVTAEQRLLLKSVATIGGLMSDLKV